jgi:hypothetical protein
MGLTVHAGGEFDPRNRYHDPYQLTSLVVGLAGKLSVLGATRVLFSGPEALESSLDHMRQFIQLVRLTCPFPVFFGPSSLPLRSSCARLPTATRPTPSAVPVRPFRSFINGFAFLLTVSLCEQRPSVGVLTRSALYYRRTQRLSLPPSLPPSLPSITV